MARWENRDDPDGGRAFQNTLPIVMRILASPIRRETWLRSAQLQQSVVSDLQRCMRPSLVSADHARFAVLGSPVIPTILIAAGFLTNPGDATLLGSPHHQLRLAQEIRAGVQHYVARL